MGEPVILTHLVGLLITFEVRQLSQDIILKVTLPDSANKIGVTLKVVRSQTAGEVITMIHRKVTVENSHQCSLFYPAKNIWLDNSKSLEEYDIEQNVSGLSFSFFFFSDEHFFKIGGPGVQEQIPSADGGGQCGRRGAADHGPH